MSRYDLLPPNATPLERDVSRAVSSLQRVGPPVPIIRSAKRTNIPDSVVPWLIYEYGLGELLPYLGNDQRLALRDGVLWQRIRGTPESVRVALSWLGIEGLIEETERGTTRWAEYMLGLSAATQGPEIIDRIAAVTRISSPVRSRLQRIYAVYDFRRAVYDACDWDEGAIYDDHSGVRPRPDWPQISYGRVYSSYVALSITVGSSQAPSIATYLEAYPRFRWDEDRWDEGWHTLNPSSVLTVQRGLSGRYEGQVWGAFRWLQDKPWADVNVVVSSSWNGTPTDPPLISGVTIAGATGIQNGILNAGDVVSIGVALNRAVLVTGPPSLALNIGGTIRAAGYASGSGTASLVFSYTIQQGDNDEDGISIPANGLSLNGGVIRDTAGNGASLTHSALPNNLAFRVDTSTPSMPSFALAVDTGVSSSDGITSNGLMQVTGLEPGGGWEYSVNSGGGWATGSGTSFVLAQGSYAAGAIRVRQFDAAGNTSLSAQNAGPIVVDTTAPLAPALTFGALPTDLSLTAEAGAAVAVVLSRSGGGTLNKSVTGAGPATAVQVPISAADLELLGAGVVNASATATDAAGNTSVAATGSFVIQADTGFDYQGFASTAGLNLVDVVGVVSNNILLTDTVSSEDYYGGTRGNVWATKARKYNRDWSTAWRMEISGGNGADGFTIQWFTNATTVGGFGALAGRVANANVPYALSVRTYYTLLNLYTANVETAFRSLGFNARQDLYYWLDYSHANSGLRLFVSQTSTKPATAIHEFTGVSFTNTEYYIGIGASTGGSDDNHILKAWSLSLL